MTKILLVEDDKSLREIYGVRLLAEGYDIVSAGDGEEALAMAVKELPNLIISDVMMPRVSGFDMLDILRANPPTRGIKVIMMTALSSEDQRKRGEQLGADRYLVKSQVGIEDVVKTVHEVLGDGHLTAEQRIADKNMPSQEENIPPIHQNTPQQAQVSQSASQQIYQSLAAPAQMQSVAQTQANTDFGQQNFSTPRMSAPQPAREMPTLSNLNRPAPQPIARPTMSQQAQASQPMPQSISQPASAVPVQHSAQPQQSAQAPFESPRQEVAQYSQAPQSTLPQPTAPFSTDRPAGLGERVIQPPVQSPESEAREAQFAAELENVLGGFSQQSTSVDIPVSDDFSRQPVQQNSSEQPQFGAR